MQEMIDGAVNQGFAIAVAVYLLWERSRFNQKIVETMQEISTTIKERMPDMTSVRL